MPIDRTGNYIVSYYKYFLNIFSLKNNLFTVLNFLFFFVFLSSIINLFIRYRSTTISTNIVLDLRNNFANSILSANWSYFLSKPTGELVSVFVVDAGRTTSGYVDTINFLSNLLQGLIIFIITFFVSAQIAIYSIIVGIFFYFKILEIKLDYTDLLLLN